MTQYTKAAAEALVADLNDGTLDVTYVAREAGRGWEIDVVDAQGNTTDTL